MMKLEMKSYTHVNQQNYELDYCKNKIEFARTTLEKVQDIGRIMEQSTKQSKNIEESLHRATADIDEVNKNVKQPYISKSKYKSQDYKKTYNTHILKRKNMHMMWKKGHLSHNCCAR